MSLTPRIDALDRPNLRSSEGAGTTTLSYPTDKLWQIFNISAGRTCVLPSTNILAGQVITLQNRANFLLTVQSSDLTTITLANAGTGSVGAASIYKGAVKLIALQNTPTTSSHWLVLEAYEEYSATLDNQFTGGTCRFVRNGRVVTIIATSFTWSGSRSSTQTSDNFIPASMTPVSESNNLVRPVGSTNSVLNIQATQSNRAIVVLNHTDTDLGTLTSVTVPGGLDLNVTYVAG